MKQKKKVAIIGYGNMGAWHAKKIKLFDVLDVAVDDKIC